MMKGNVWIRGRLIPITSVVGDVLAFAAWVVALGTHPGARVVGPLWMVGRPRRSTSSSACVRGCR